MGQITFKENGSIQFKGGSLTFLSYTPMTAPTVTVQWIYETGMYRAKVTIINNHEYDAILNYTVRLGATVETYTVTLTGLDNFTRSFYNLPKSPDNGFLFKVEAFIEDEDHVRPNSATILKESTANFRRYLYNEGQDFANLRDEDIAGDYDFIRDANYIFMRSKAPQYGSGVLGLFPDDGSTISPSTDKKLWIDWHFISGDNDQDFIEITYKTSKKTLRVGSGREESFLDIVDTGNFYHIYITLSDYISPGGWPSVNIYKIYIETINNGPIV